MFLASKCFITATYVNYITSVKIFTIIKFKKNYKSSLKF